jgi:hypothetical protein
MRVDHARRDGRARRKARMRYGLGRQPADARARRCGAGRQRAARSDPQGPSAPSARWAARHRARSPTCTQSYRSSGRQTRSPAMSGNQRGRAPASPRPSARASCVRARGAWANASRATWPRRGPSPRRGDRIWRWRPARRAIDPRGDRPVIGAARHRRACRCDARCAHIAGSGSGSGAGSGTGTGAGARCGHGGAQRRAGRGPDVIGAAPGRRRLGAAQRDGMDLCGLAACRARP